MSLLEHHLERLDLRIDYNRKRRGSICLTPTKLESLPIIGHSHCNEKSEKLKSKMSGILRKNFLFSALSPDLLLQTIDRMWLVEKRSGEVIYQENETADLFYYFEEGECNVIKSKLVNSTVSPSEKPILGEIALFQKSTRDSGLVAKVDCKLWALDGCTYRSLLCVNNKSKIEHYEKMLQKMPFFSGSFCNLNFVLT
jgi:hypothetical protein